VPHTSDGGDTTTRQEKSKNLRELRRLNQYFEITNGRGKQKMSAGSAEDQRRRQGTSHVIAVAGMNPSSPAQGKNADRAQYDRGKRGETLGSRTNRTISPTRLKSEGGGSERSKSLGGPRTQQVNKFPGKGARSVLGGRFQGSCFWGG